MQLAWSSSKISSIKEPIMMLNLTISDPQNNRKDVILELTLPELDKLIASLEAANKVQKKKK